MTTLAEQLAAFVAASSWGDLEADVRHALKLRILDALGCAIGAEQGEPMRLLRRQVDEFGGSPRCTLIGGGRTSPDRAALYNGALVRYLDFNDAYLAKGETCHPSDNLGAVLAGCEAAGGSGRDLLVALAVAYQVQCRLSDVAPVRARGFDHTTQGAYAVAAGVSRALGLDAVRTTHALAIAGTAYVSLRVARTGALSNYKGLAYPNIAFGATHATFLASQGITGPKEVFEGNKGFMQSVSGPFEIDWSREGHDRVLLTILKRYNAEIHSQSAIEGLLELQAQERFQPQDVERVEIDTFDVAHQIIGGGEEGDKTIVRTKEEADHSLPYMAAVALLDGQLMPEQYAPSRIRHDDVQTLLRRVVVRPVPELSARFPEEHPCRMRVTLSNGRVLAAEKRDYEGFCTRPMPDAAVIAKFERLTGPLLDERTRKRIVGAVMDLESISTSELCDLLATSDVAEVP